MTPKDREEYVRSKWKPSLFDGGLYLYEGARSYQLRLGNRKFDYTQKHKDECWSAAYAFTLEREEQIRQVEEEIAWLEVNGGSTPAAKRIFTSRQAALAELEKGMRQ